MGKVVVNARIENLGDLYSAKRGITPQESVRFVEIPDALIDTGATGLGLPKSVIERLGLDYFRTRRVRTSGGTIDTRMFGTAWITIQGRDCPCDVMELPDECPVLIGQIPLEAIDFVVDPSAQRLIGNPAHGGEHILEMY